MKPKHQRKRYKLKNPATSGLLNSSALQDVFYQGTAMALGEFMLRLIAPDPKTLFKIIGKNSDSSTEVQRDN